MSYFFNKRESSGIFKPSNGGFAEYKGDIGNGSINDIRSILGYHADQVYGRGLGNGNDKINYVCFEIFTRNVVFVRTSKKVTFITQRDIDKSLGKFSVSKHFDRKEISDRLSDGIDNCSMSIGFMAKVLSLKDVSRNGMFYSEKIKTYLYFTEGFLTDFHFDDGLFPYAKDLKAVNPTVYNWIAGIAYKYWPNNDFQAIKEINTQCEAWANIPEAFGNEFIPLHRTENGGANLHMIRVCHYNYPINISQFKEINHGRFETLDDEQGNPRFKCGKFTYLFDQNSEMLISTSLNV